MASNILAVPFRRTHSVSLSDAIKEYISSKYDQHPDMFKQDLETIDYLRTAAVQAIDPHITGIKKLQSYAAQLIWLGGKFPIDIGVDFSWYPALGYNLQRPVSQNNVRFELANVLFNLAAMYSQLAVSLNRTTSDGLKTACNYFCLSAGVLSYLRTDIIPDMRASPPDDMDTSTLECVEQLMLAQAQECFWQKAVKDGLKDASIAKLAAKVSDLYSDAVECGVKSDTISSEWIHHMNAKHHHFAAAAQYRAACDCLEKRKYGEEVARLIDAVSCVNEALKEARYVNKTVLGDLNGIKNRVQEDLKRAEKDNNMIYLLPVPPKSELKTLDRATMVSSKVPKEIFEATSMLGENSDLGHPLFSKLVPYSVHVAASIYADRRDRLVNHDIVDQLEDMTNAIHRELSSLNLPGSLQALEKPLGLPSTLLSHAEEIRQQDGVVRLRRSIAETEKLRHGDRAVFQEGVDLLRGEIEEDERARQKHGTVRWTRPTSELAVPKLYGQIQEIDGYFSAANSSDTLITSKLKENERLLNLLSGTDYDLEKFVPSSRRVVMTPAVERESSNLRACLNDLTRLESRRRRKIEGLRSKAKQDDINTDLLRETARLEREYPMQKIEAVQFEGLFEKRLRLYDSDKAAVETEREEQDGLLKNLHATNQAFVNARRGENSTKTREDALQSLENAFYKYKEIISNLHAARKFYNDLAKIVTRFRDDCKNFAYQRRMEASEVEGDLANAMSGINLQQAANLQNERLAEAQAPSYRQRPPTENQIPAPQPTRTTLIPTPGVWTPEMPIRFGQNSSTSGNTKDGRWDPAQGVKFS
ncbi:BRO1-domain-containing protein [Eremomyces bilateralis CBS 781.70]|uniref:BRO1-domain-containing protein n=1 Tax=Eremomyces bilateralis CBS 781.70 TaxID=1392243 RepID=A0A6G1G929_9PEZI|nr:BRO1-domain-containing protein [Eremomyces bilateralis CBS 781.70]KAF1814411.1 BRO1-domain-containing protein [Eremomyces bilateralis CBS 781.70]